ncbi:MAG: DUF308 domain-containing protein [Lachnospiraceae bacterium]|nr:DUF308 domain-containing protein [Lachnospiraceae bacterium]MBQ5431506.1 DUF308 domain-containing protein [Lachnospiraceae bacterium]
MKRLKSLRLNVSVSAVLMLVIGTICILNPDSVSNFLAKIIGVVLVLVAAIMFLGRISDERLRVPALIIAAMIAALGLFIFTNPNQFTYLIFLVFGIILVVDGLQDVTMAFAGKAAKAPRWWGPLILGGIDLALGVLCVAGQFVKLSIAAIGIMLLYDGISSLFVVHKVNSAERVIDTVITREEDV